MYNAPHERAAISAKPAKNTASYKPLLAYQPPATTDTVRHDMSWLEPRDQAQRCLIAGSQL